MKSSGKVALITGCGKQTGIGATTARAARLRTASPRATGLRTTALAAPALSTTLAAPTRGPARSAAASSFCHQWSTVSRCLSGRLSAASRSRRRRRACPTHGRGGPTRVPAGDAFLRMNRVGNQKKRPRPVRVHGAGSPEKNSGGVLLSQGVPPQVPSALAVFTSVFGMGTGVSPPL